MYLSLLVIDHNVVRLHISVHYALAVTEIQRLQQLKYVVSDIVVLEFWVQAPEVGIVNIFEDQRGCFTLQST
jgi:hypothetical protein